MHEAEPTESISLRLTQEQHDLIGLAAEFSGKTIESFLVDAAYSRAQWIVPGPRTYVVNDEQWEAFMQALEAPVSDKPRLRQLLQEPTILDSHSK